MNERKTSVSIGDIRALAEAMRIELDDGSARTLQGDIEAILDYAARLDEYTGDAEADDTLPRRSGREDIPAPPFAWDDMLRNASDTEDGCFCLPCVLPSETEVEP